MTTVAPTPTTPYITHAMPSAGLSTPRSTVQRCVSWLMAPCREPFVAHGAADRPEAMSAVRARYLRALSLKGTLQVFAGFTAGGAAVLAAIAGALAPVVAVPIAVGALALEARGTYVTRFADDKLHGLSEGILAALGR